MDKKGLKDRALKAIEDNQDRIIGLGRKLYKNPELGYKEEYATEQTLQEMKKIGLEEIEEALAITGCSGKLKGNKGGPHLAVMGELDAVICGEHPDAAQETGAVHACGHNIQTAAMIGAAYALASEGILDNLSGEIDFIAVPAEEYVELEYRFDLRQEGKISYFGGKQELIKRGYFDDIQLAMMVHSLDLKDKKVLIGPSGNGFVGKKVQFIGKEAHAGGAPEEGINALNAAMLAINNINAQRETFPDEERIRVHPIITKGGDIVNIVPADVRMESYVRGRTIEGLLSANDKVNRALKAGGSAVGAEVEINDIPGYLPLKNESTLDQIFRDNSLNFVKEDEIEMGASFTGSFDFGDITHLMPGLHPFTGGVEGNIHTRDFKIKSEEDAYLLPARIMALTIIDLLYNEAEKAKQIISDYKPSLNKKEYLKLMKKIDRRL